MKFVTTSHIFKKPRSICILASAFIASMSCAAPAFSQVDYSSSDYKVILYDAETIAKVNAEKSQEVTPTPQPQTIPAASVVETIRDEPQITQAPRFPRDISAEFIDVIEGVPVMKDPESCGKGLLEIGVTVENVASDKGTIVADLHDDIKENFLVWDKVVLRVRADAKKGETTFCMPLTKPGDYAIAIYHDKNGNKEFDKNFLGIPSEHFGMSNNPKFGLKSPEYEQAVFTVPETGSEIKIRLLKAGDILGGQKR